MAGLDERHKKRFNMMAIGRLHSRLLPHEGEMVHSEIKRTNGQTVTNLRAQKLKSLMEALCLSFQDELLFPSLRGF